VPDFTAVPIQRRLAGAFVLALGISVLVVVLSYRTTGRFIRSSRAAAATSRTTLELERVMSLLQDAETGQRGYLLTGDEGYLEPYRNAVARLPSERRMLASAAGPADAGTVALIGRLSDVKLAELERSIRTYREKGAGPARAMVANGSGKLAMDSIRAAGRALEQVLESRYRSNAELSQSQARDAQGTIALLSALTIILLATAFMALIRQVRVQAEATTSLREERGQLEARIVERTAALNEQVARTQGALAQAERAASEARVSEQQAAAALEQSRLSMAALAGSEARFRELADAMPQVVWTARPDGYLDYFNRRWYELTAAPQGRGGDASWIPYVHPDDVSRCLERWYHSVRTGEPFELEHRFRDAGSGRWRWHLVRALAARDAGGAIVRWYGTATDIDDQKRAADILRRAQESRRIAIDAGGLGTWNWTGTEGELSCDRRCRNILGLAADGAVTWDAFLAGVHPDDRERVAGAMHSALAGGPDAGDYEAEYRVLGADGTVRWVAAKGRAYQDAGENRRRLHGVAMDVSDRKRVEERLRQVERMGSVGRLAGGVAHEVNNMMTAVLGFGTFALQDLARGGTPLAEVEEMVKAGRRAAAITQQLLAFSRRQVLQPSVLSVEDVVGDLGAMLGKLAGSNRDLVIRPSDTQGQVKADRGQLEQVVVNLVLNARDATAAGGRILVETGAATLDDSYRARHGEVSIVPRRYAMIAVSDTGSGMSAETRARVFEPFFTTKPVGQGTGLGLSTVYGIVKQSEGYVWVYSEPGMGTTIKVYLPMVDEPAPVPAAPEPPHRAPDRGDATVLVVEDEESVRTLATRALGELGYDALAAADGRAALDLLAARGGRVDLVVTDLVMPGMNGRQLGDELARLHPDVRVLYMSGYTDDDAMLRGLVAPDAPFVAKPFSPEGFARRVQEALGR
jgi:PAS domain S-box-containing protein